MLSNSGAELTNALILLSTCSLFYESQVIDNKSSEVVLIVNGVETLIALNLLLETSNNREVPAGNAGAIIKASCFLLIFVSIFGLSYASTASIVKLFSSSLSVKLVPTIFFNLDVVVFNKL